MCLFAVTCRCLDCLLCIAVVSASTAHPFGLQSSLAYLTSVHQAPTWVARPLLRRTQMWYVCAVASLLFGRCCVAEPVAAPQPIDDCNIVVLHIHCPMLSVWLSIAGFRSEEAAPQEGTAACLARYRPVILSRSGRGLAASAHRKQTASMKRASLWALEPHAAYVLTRSTSITALLAHGMNCLAIFSTRAHCNDKLFLIPILSS